MSMETRSEIKEVQRRIEQLSEWMLENDLLYRRGKLTEEQYTTIRDLYEIELEANIKRYYELLKSRG